MFTRFVRLFLIFTTLFFLGACSKKLNQAQLVPGIDTGETYYTQFSFFQEKDHYRTTNYRRGSLIPINTPVTLVSIDKQDIVITLKDTGQKITIENVPKHTLDDSQQAFKKLLGKRRVDLSIFAPEEQAAILAGQARKGMSKKAVLAALGYPPRHATASLDLNEWTYWSSRYDRFVVRFRNDRVTEITS